MGTKRINITPKNISPAPTPMAVAPPQQHEIIPPTIQAIESHKENLAAGFNPLEVVLLAFEFAVAFRIAS